MVSHQRNSSPAIAAVVDLLRDRSAELGQQVAAIVADAAPYFGPESEVTYEDLVTGCTAQLVSILDRLTNGDDYDLSAAHLTGRLRAAAGVPLSVVMNSYRVGSRHIWQVIAEAVLDAGVPADELVSVTDEIWDAQGVFTHAMSEAYRSETTSRLLTQQSERTALVDALLSGQLVTRDTLWEIAELLKLPVHGPFVVVVVAARPEGIGHSALPGIAARLQAAGVVSAWQLMPDLEAGIVHMEGNGQQRALRGALSRHNRRQIGISPVFDELSQTARGLRFARMAMETAIHGGVVEFDDAPLAVAAVASPDVTQRISDVVFSGLDLLRDDQRELLLDTLDAWIRAGGSAAAAGDALHCHPNTVRQRLHRLEERTGRNLSNPRDVTELTLALEGRKR